MHARLRSCRTLLVGAVVLAPLACTHAARGMSDADAPPNTITEEAIENVHAITAYEAIMKIHANFFSFRGRTSLRNTSQPDPTVYLDDVPYGPMSSLRTIPAEQVSSIRLYRAWEATTKFGMGNMGGVIEVTTKH